MKAFLFNLYKVYYYYSYRNDPDSEPNFLKSFGACVVVFLFIGIVITNIDVFRDIILGIPVSGKQNKPVMWLFLFVGYCAVYILLFKVLGLKNLNYCLPEYKPDKATIRKTWWLCAVNVAILILLITVKKISI